MHMLGSTCVAVRLLALALEIVHACFPVSAFRQDFQTTATASGTWYDDQFAPAADPVSIKIHVSVAAQGSFLRLTL